MTLLINAPSYEMWNQKRREERRRCPGDRILFKEAFNCVIDLAGLFHMRIMGAPFNDLDF